MQIDSATETRESWIPLENTLGSAQCGNFMWMGLREQSSFTSTWTRVGTCSLTQTLGFSMTRTIGHSAGKWP